LDKGEKRRSPRVRTEKATAGRLKLTVPVAIRDVSLYGVRLELSSAVRPGQIYDMKAELKGVTLSAQGADHAMLRGGLRTDVNGSRVLQYNAGAEFALIADDQRKLLEQWIEKEASLKRPSSGRSAG